MIILRLLVLSGSLFPGPVVHDSELWGLHGLAPLCKKVVIRKIETKAPEEARIGTSTVRTAYSTVERDNLWDRWMRINSRRAQQPLWAAEQVRTTTEGITTAAN